MEKHLIERERAMRMLIAVEDSTRSDAVLQLGIQFLQISRTGETPTLLTVAEDQTGRAQAEALLARARQVLQAAGKAAHTKVRVGRAVDEIVNEVQKHPYDLLVLGMRAETGLLRRWLPSTTTQVVEGVGCSVAIAKGQVRPFRHILVCDSGARNLSLLDHFVTQLGALLEPTVAITVLHVMSQISAGPQVRGEHLRADAEELMRAHSPEGEWLAQDVQILREAHVQPTPKVRHGFVVDEILDEARLGNYDLVVIGAHQKEGWTSFLLENLARQITLQLDRPVLLVR
jgi:nucleotide-binding universal stress UspA family protein